MKNKITENLEALYGQTATSIESNINQALIIYQEPANGYLSLSKGMNDEPQTVANEKFVTVSQEFMRTMSQEVVQLQRTVQQLSRSLAQVQGQLHHYKKLHNDLSDLKREIGRLQPFGTWNH